MAASTSAAAAAAAGASAAASEGDAAASAAEVAFREGAHPCALLLEPKGYQAPREWIEAHGEEWDHLDDSPLESGLVGPRGLKGFSAVEAPNFVVEPGSVLFRGGWVCGEGVFPNPGEPGRLDALLELPRPLVFSSGVMLEQKDPAVGVLYSHFNRDTRTIGPGHLRERMHAFTETRAQGSRETLDHQGTMDQILFHLTNQARHAPEELPMNLVLEPTLEPSARREMMKVLLDDLSVPAISVIDKAPATLDHQGMLRRACGSMLVDIGGQCTTVTVHAPSGYEVVAARRLARDLGAARVGRRLGALCGATVSQDTIWPGTHVLQWHAGRAAYCRRRGPALATAECQDIRMWPPSAAAPFRADQAVVIEADQRTLCVEEAFFTPQQEKEGNNTAGGAAGKAGDTDAKDGPLVALILESVEAAREALAAAAEAPAAAAAAAAAEGGGPTGGGRDLEEADDADYAARMAGLDPDRLLENVCLVGGAALIPQLAERLEHELASSPRSKGARVSIYCPEQPDMAPYRAGAVLTHRMRPRQAEGDVGLLKEAYDEIGDRALDMLMPTAEFIVSDSRGPTGSRAVKAARA